ncbi:unnamed protein product [Caretta caretta]
MTSPRWLLIDSPDDGDHSGVWWLCSRPVRPGIGTETPFVKAIRALLLFALLASSVAVASLLVSVRPFARWRGSRFLVSATANFIAGLLVLISVVIFTAHVMLASVNPQARASFEWAFFLAWTLSPLFVLSDLLGAPGICLTFAALAGFVAVLSCCSRLACDLLISAAASFTAGLSGLTAMVLYTLAEPGHAATLNITWTFCLASSRCP